MNKPSSEVGDESRCLGFSTERNADVWGREGAEALARKREYLHNQIRKLLRVKIKFMQIR
jgi:hypothetical protein